MLPRLRNSRQSGVFSVPCWAEPKWAEESRTDPSRERVAICVASPHLVLPGNSYKHLDDARVGKGHVTAQAVTSRVSNNNNESVSLYVRSKGS
jgi:hypothetical protein